MNCGENWLYCSFRYSCAQKANSPQENTQLCEIGIEWMFIQECKFNLNSQTMMADYFGHPAMHRCKEACA